MKKFFILLVALLSVNISTAQNWQWQNPLPQGNELVCVNFSNINTGCAVGVNGTILKTTNGGNLWTIQNSGTSNDLSSVYFTDANTGYAVGDSGIILKTTDGGTNWLIQNSGTSNWLGSVVFSDANTGYVVGAQGTILKTINAGLTWTIQNSGSSNVLKSVYFHDTNTGYAVGFGGTILKTMNGGLNWSRLNSGTVNDLYSIYFTDINTFYVVGSYGTILKTTNALSINESSIAFKLIKTYPNPTTDKFTVESSAMMVDTRLSLFNVNGEELIKRQITKPKTQIDISNLSTGVYFIRFKNEKTVEMGKIIKE